MKQILVFIIILALIDQSFLLAQDKLNFPKVDKKTYSYYKNNDWKELVKLGKLSKKAGIDFYYLQVRMGIAYYNLKKYRLAIPYLEKALENSTDNDFLREYLYFAYLFSGRGSDASKLTITMDRQFLEKSGIRSKSGLSSLSVGYQSDTWNDYAITPPSTTDTLVQYVQNSFSYFSLGFDITLQNKSKLIFNYSRIKTNEDFSDINLNDIPITGYQDISQNQFYAAYVLNAGKGLNLLFSGTMLNMTMNQTIFSVSESSSGSGFGGGSTTTTNVRKIKTVKNEFVGCAGIYKDFSLFKLGVSSSISNLYGGMQLQPGLSLTFYPLANSMFYTLSNAYYQFEKYDDIKYQTPIFRQAIGIGLWGLYLEPSVTFGELSSFVESDGLVILNPKDIIEKRYEFLAYTWLFKGRLKLYLKYQQDQKRNYYSINEIVGITNYNHQSITGGIKWNF